MEIDNCFFNITPVIHVSIEVSARTSPAKTINSNLTVGFSLKELRRLLDSVKLSNVGKLYCRISSKFYKNVF